MSDFKLALTLIRNAFNLKNKVFGMLFLTVICLTLAAIRFMGKQEYVQINILFILFVWCIRMVPVNEIYIYMTSSLVLSSPQRKRILVRVAAKLNVLLNFIFYLFLSGLYAGAYNAGKIDAKDLTANLLTAAAGGFLITVYILTYYKRMWLSVVVLTVIVAAETVFYELFYEEFPVFQKISESVPLFGTFLIGLGVIALSCLYAWGYAVLTYKRPADPGAVRAVIKSGKM